MSTDEPGSSGAHAPDRSFRRFVFGCAMVAVALAAWYVYACGVSARGASERLGPGTWLLLGGLVFCGLAGPSLVQYLALRRAGLNPVARREPRYDPPYLRSSWETPRGHRFTRGQFAAAYAAPVLLFVVAMLAYAVLTSSAVVTIFLGLAVPRLAGVLWYLLEVLDQPSGTLVEVVRDGIRLHEPVLGGVLDSRS